jgi:hypothetical protein
MFLLVWPLSEGDHQFKEIRMTAYVVLKWLKTLVYLNQKISRIRHATTDTLYPQKSALTSPTSGSRSVGIVRLQTKATEFVLLFVCVKKQTVCFN